MRRHTEINQLGLLTHEDDKIESLSVFESPSSSYKIHSY